MDVLSEVLSVCRSEYAVPARFRLTAPWGLESLGVPGVLMRVARGAPYWMEMGGQSPVQVQPGDIVLLSPRVAHRIVSEPGLAATPFSELIARHAVGPRGENPLVFDMGRGGAVTDMFSMQVWFSAYCRHSVLRIVPDCIHVGEADLPIAGILGSAMQALTEETLGRRPGWRLSASRMGELLLVNLLRRHLLGLPSAEQGWLRGIGDPAIARSIMGMHRHPQRDWTVASLAQEASLSRTRFSDRFRELVGATPIGYLTAHRMALAAQTLEAGNAPLDRIAQDAGYESGKEFARAFKRWSGAAPRIWVKREMESRRSLDGPSQLFGDAA